MSSFHYGISGGGGSGSRRSSSSSSMHLSIQNECKLRTAPSFAHRHKRTLLLALYVCIYVCMYIYVYKWEVYSQVRRSFYLFHGTRGPTFCG